MSADGATIPNAGIFIVGLPEGTTYSDIFYSIRYVGPVKRCHIVQPDRTHPLQGARIEFFSHKAAQTVMNQSQNGILKIKGQPPDLVRWNEPNIVYESAREGRTRVLLITGKPEVVNQNALEAYWRRKVPTFHWVLERVSEPSRVNGTGLTSVHYYFAACPRQAETAYKILRNRSDERGDVEVRYAPDPCAWCRCYRCPRPNPATCPGGQ